MKLNRKWLMVIALVMSLAMATGGTLAYLTATDAEVNIFTMGNVKIDLTEEFEQLTLLLPGVDVDKKVDIKNTGTNDTWVFATIAVPAQGNDALISLDLDESNTNWKLHSESPKTITLDNQTYWMYTYLCEKSLAAGETTGTLLEAVTLNSKVDCVDGKYYLVTNGSKAEVTYDLTKAKVYVNAYAIQKDNFADVTAGYNAYVGQWGDNEGNLTEDNINQGNDNLAAEPDDDTEFEDAVTNPDAETIYVRLTGNTTYDVAAWQNDAMGGTNTKRIVIEGNGYTLKFNQTNSDWNNIVTNGATLVIQNAKITNIGKNDGPWNRHDLNFACDVELTNVTSDKALAFKAGATLNNVTINDPNTSDTYAIWIQPNGQTVTINNSTIDMAACTDGRGIKIDEQYVDNPQKVTLNVSNTKFITEEKAAILVKSEAGADINLNNINIAGVAQDTTNAVWVDEASTDYADLVTVTGGTKINESALATVSTQDALRKAISEGATIITLEAGNYTLSDMKANETYTFTGNGDSTVFDFTKAYDVKGAAITFTNLKIQGKNENVMSGFGVQSTTADIVYNDCTFDGAVTNEFYGTVTYNNCKFTGTGYITTYAVKSATFNNCTFDKADSRAILVYSHGDNPLKVVVDDCTFKAAAKGYTGAGDWTAAVEVDTTNIKTAGTTVTVTDCTFDNNYSAIVRDKSAAGATPATITKNGNSRAN